jgi:hypothetical protein
MKIEAPNHKDSSKTDANAKIDFKRQLKEFYTASNTRIGFVKVPEWSFPMIDESGDPNASAGFQFATGALHKLAYTLEFSIRKTSGKDFVLGPSEGLWWNENMNTFYLGRCIKFQNGLETGCCTLGATQRRARHAASGAPLLSTQRIEGCMDSRDLLLWSLTANVF